MNSYGFIGLGLIGGSIARKLRQVQPEAKIFICTRNEETKEQAEEAGILDGVFSADGAFRAYTTTAGGAFAGATYSLSLDMLFLCAPVEANLEFLERVAKWAPATTTISDVGSVKTPIIKKAKKLKLKNFVGGHPMMGTEFSGYAASDPGMVKDSAYLVVPTQISDQEHVKRLSDFIRLLEARPMTVQGEDHDRALAAISHLPHVASAALCRVASSEDKEVPLKELCAGGFKDITRISSSDPKLWAEISLENREHVLTMTAKLEEELKAYRELLEKKDQTGLEDFFSGARAYRKDILI